MNCRTLLRQSINTNSTIFPCGTGAIWCYMITGSARDAQTHQYANLWIVRQVISQPLHSRTFCTVAINQM